MQAIHLAFAPDFFPSSLGGIQFQSKLPSPPDPKRKEKKRKESTVNISHFTQKAAIKVVYRTRLWQRRLITPGKFFFQLSIMNCLFIVKADDLQCVIFMKWNNHGNTCPNFWTKMLKTHSLVFHLHEWWIVLSFYKLQTNILLVLTLVSKSASVSVTVKVRWKILLRIIALAFNNTGIQSL